MEEREFVLSKRNPRELCAFAFWSKQYKLMFSFVLFNGSELNQFRTKYNNFDRRSALIDHCSRLIRKINENADYDGLPLRIYIPNDELSQSLGKKLRFVEGHLDICELMDDSDREFKFLNFKNILKETYAKSLFNDYDGIINGSENI